MLSGWMCSIVRRISLCVYIHVCVCVCVCVYKESCTYTYIISTVKPPQINHSSDWTWMVHLWRHSVYRISHNREKTISVMQRVHQYRESVALYVWLVWEVLLYVYGYSFICWQTSLMFTDLKLYICLWQVQQSPFVNNDPSLLTPIPGSPGCSTSSPPGSPASDSSETPKNTLSPKTPPHKKNIFQFGVPPPNAAVYRVAYMLHILVALVGINWPLFYGECWWMSVNTESTVQSTVNSPTHELCNIIKYSSSYKDDWMIDCWLYVVYCLLLL